MPTLAFLRQLPKPFLVLVAAYFITSLGHFAHNAEFICEYPNLPAWLTRAKVYAALGFDCLDHYAVAPMAHHTLDANITILSEAAAAALL